MTHRTRSFRGRPSARFLTSNRVDEAIAGLESSHDGRGRLVALAYRAAGATTMMSAALFGTSIPCLLSSYRAKPLLRRSGQTGQSMLDETTSGPMGNE